MPDFEMETVSNEQLLDMILASTPKLIILDLRTFSEFQISKIRNSVNFSIPSILKKRLIAGKIDLCSIIKSEKLKEKIISNYRENIFILYNDCAEDDLIYVLNRKLKQDGVMNVKILENGFTSFRKRFPEWCEEENANTTLQSSCNTTEQLMGLRSLRISTPFSDSASSSSTDSSDGVGSSNEMYGSEPVEILPGLFLGNSKHSEDLNALNKYNIRHILNVTPDLPNVFEETGKIEYLKIPITDHFSQDLSLHFPTAIKFIEEAQNKNSSVLVHCLAGVSRSVTITLAYLMQAKKLCFNDAFLLVRACKPDVSPNFHFLHQLHEFERQLKEFTTLSSSITDDIQPNEMRQIRSSIQRQSTDDRCHQRNSKYSCTCFEKECKCFHNDLLGPLTGVSPDSGIEFDRWTPNDVGVTPK